MANKLIRLSHQVLARDYNFKEAQHDHVEELLYEGDRDKLIEKYLEHYKFSYIIGFDPEWSDYYIDYFI